MCIMHMHASHVRVSNKKGNSLLMHVLCGIRIDLRYQCFSANCMSVWIEVKRLHVNFISACILYKSLLNLQLLHNHTILLCANKEGVQK